MVHKMGVEMKCNQCDYKTVNKQHLKVHKESIHQGITYPCSLCGYLGTIKQSLKEHERSKHGLWKLNCDLCDETFSERLPLRDHMKTVHGTEMEIQKRSRRKFVSKPRQVNRENIF